MVADAVVGDEVLERPVHEIDIVGELEVVIVPVKVPCHIAEGDSVGLALDAVGIDVLDKVTELLDVVGAVCKVHVAEEEHAVVCLVNFVEAEVDALGCRGRTAQQFVVDGHDAVGDGVVAGGNRHEDVSEGLLGLELVAALLVGDGEVDTVADNDIGDGTGGAGNLAVYGGAFGGSPAFRVFHYIF